MKACTHCKVHQPLEEFAADARLKSGRRAWCKSCQSHKNRAYRYGITLEDYEALLKAQLFRCAVCHEAFDDNNRACVDHDHECCPGRIGCGRCNRGLICDRCNKALGLFEDKVELLHAAVEYLVRLET